VSQVAGPETLNLSDAEFQAAVRRDCLDSAPQQMEAVQRALQAFAKHAADPKALHDLYRSVHNVTGNTGLVGLNTISKLSGALEALLRELEEKPGQVTPSTLRTVAQSVDCLKTLFHCADTLDDSKPVQGAVLVVDDEELVRRTVTHAIHKVGLRVVQAAGSDEALQIAGEQEFDLITLDIEMPGMSGIELCSRLVAMPKFQATPIVFITARSDFGHRAQVCLKGANDLIAKPFLYTELAAKALTLVLKYQLLQRKLGSA